MELKGKTGRRKILPTTARGLRQLVEGNDVSMHMRCAKTTSEAIGILKNQLQQGISIGSFMCVEVLKRCLNQKDRAAVKQVHDCIIESGLEQHKYVAKTLLSVYIKCGRLHDACRLFDRLVKKDVMSWTVVIGGYGQHNRIKDAMEIFKQMCQEGVHPNEIT